MLNYTDFVGLYGCQTVPSSWQNMGIFDECAPKRTAAQQKIKSTALRT